MRPLLTTFGLAISLLSVGCISAATAYPKDGGQASHGHNYCADLAKDAAGVSVGESGAGWAIGASALGAGIAGTLMSSANSASEKPNTSVGITGAALTAGSAILIPVALAFFSRSDAASTLSQQANEALSTKDDLAAYERCVAAKGAWEASRMDSTKIAKAAMEKKVEQAEAQEKKIEEAEAAKNKAEAAKKEAEDAKTKAEQEKQAAETARTEAEKKVEKLHARSQSLESVLKKNKIPVPSDEPVSPR